VAEETDDCADVVREPRDAGLDAVAVRDLVMDSVDQRLEVALARRGRVVMIVTARCEDVQRADDAVLADAGRIARIALVRSQVDRVGTDQPSVVFGLDARLVVIEAERLVVAQSVRNEDVGHHDDPRQPPVRCRSSGGSARLR